MNPKWRLLGVVLSVAVKVTMMSPCVWMLNVTCAFAHVGVVGAGPCSPTGDPHPVPIVSSSLDHAADVFTFKVTCVQEGGALSWKTH